MYFSPTLAQDLLFHSLIVVQSLHTHLQHVVQGEDIHVVVNCLQSAILQGQVEGTGKVLV